MAAAALRRSRASHLAYRASKLPYRLTGRLPGPYLTPHTVDGRPVILVHNPKAAGSSLRALLGSDGVTHALPRHVMSPAAWAARFAVVAVRHPFDRFVSGYAYHVLSDYSGALLKAHGAALKRLAPDGYLDLIAQHPENLGPQTLWTDHPGADRPRADLVLRFEEVAEWPRRLRDAGIAVATEMPHRNAGPGGGGDPARRLGLGRDALAALRARVHKAYAGDYAAFGYGP